MSGGIIDARDPMMPEFGSQWADVGFWDEVMPTLKPQWQGAEP
jgi:hypothetical protein